MTQPTNLTTQIEEARAQLHALAASMRGEHGQLLSDILSRNPHMVAALVQNHLENLIDDLEEE